MGGKRVARPGGRNTGATPGVDWSGAWKAWVAKDAIKPVNMAGCRPPAHAFDARKDKPMNTTVIGGHNAPCRYISSIKSPAHYPRALLSVDPSICMTPSIHRSINPSIQQRGDEHWRFTENTVRTQALPWRRFS